MKKKSIAARLGVTALALTLVTTSLSSGTLAKYTSTFKAEGQFIVANWNVKSRIRSGDKDIVTMSSDIEAFDLLATVDTNKVVLDKDGKPTRVTTNRLAPGMSGSFDIALDTTLNESNSFGNATEVDVDYVVYIQPSSSRAALPQNFKIWDSTKSDTQAIDLSAPGGGYGHEIAKGMIESGGTDFTKTRKTVKLDWKWDYNENGDASNDDLDNQAGVSGTKDGGFQITVIMTQANPGESKPSSSETTAT